MRAGLQASADRGGAVTGETWAAATFFGEVKKPVGLRVSLHLADFVSNVWPFPHMGDKCDLPAVSFALFRGDRRASSNVEICTALGYDDDKGHPDPGAYVAGLRAAFPGCGWFLYSTFSSTPTAWRFRPIFALSRPVSTAEYATLWPVVAEYLEEVGVRVDMKCKDSGRLFFSPTRPPNGAYFSHVEAGAALDVDAWLDVARELAQLDAKAADAADARRAARHASRRTTGAVASPLERARRYAASVPGAVQGQDGSGATVRLALALVRGFELCDADALEILSGWNAECKPRWSARELAHKVTDAREKGRLPFGFLLNAERRRA